MKPRFAAEKTESVGAMGSMIPVLVVTRLATGTDHGGVETFTYAEAIELRDLLLRHFPVDEPLLSAGEAAALAEHGAHRERRERFATAIIQGMCREEYQTTAECDALVSRALLYADRLMAALDKEP